MKKTLRRFLAACGLATLFFGSPAVQTFRWDTDGVSPGEYYLCAQPWDGLNLTAYCSKAPVKVALP
jgi:hypothetical protein